MHRVGWRAVKWRVGVSKKKEMVNNFFINKVTGPKYLKSPRKIDVITYGTC